MRRALAAGKLPTSEPASELESVLYMRRIFNNRALLNSVISGAAVAIVIILASGAPGSASAKEPSSEELKCASECEALAKAVAISIGEGKEIKSLDDLEYRYVRDINLKDPWGKPYILDIAGGKVFSSGPDGDAGNADDIAARFEVAAGKKPVPDVGDKTDAGLKRTSPGAEPKGEGAKATPAKDETPERAPREPRGKLRGDGEGYADFNEKRYEKALDFFLAKIGKEPDNFNFNFAAGRCLDNLNRYAEAKEYYRKCIALDSKRIEAYENLGTCRLIEKDYDGALDVLKKGLETDPQNFREYCNLGIAFKNSKANDIERAIDCYKKALESEPKDIVTLYNLGSANISKNSLPEAEKYLKMALEIDPAHGDSYFNLGSAYARMGNFDKAIECYSKVIAICPSYARAYKYRGAAYKKSGKNSEAEADEKKANELEAAVRNK